MRTIVIAAAAALIAIPALAQQPPAAPPAAGQQPTEDQRMAAFKTNDKNNDGKLDKTEYKALLEGLGFAELLDQLWEQRDANPKDGFVSADEYKNPIAQ